MPGQQAMPPTNHSSRLITSEERPFKLQTSSCTKPEVYVLEDSSLAEEPGPFYGMFDGDEDEEDSTGWLHVPQSSPRHNGSIPEASETFQRVMRQLDDVPDTHKHVRDCMSQKKTAGTRLERKSSKVKKSASFSTPAAGPASLASSSNPSPSGPETKRRMSVPCMRSTKHVQWADEAGVSELVSVRLIRPRLAGKNDKEEAQSPTPSRSILRRLSGMR